MQASEPAAVVRSNPCLSCGVCCTMFRVSFHWMEAEDATPGGVPLDMVQAAPLPHRLMMRGTGSEPVRCVALEGEIGRSVRCSIHGRRPSPCRSFAASYEDGATPSPRCDEARARHGMRPLAPEDWALPAPPSPDPVRPEPDTPVRPAA